MYEKKIYIYIHEKFYTTKFCDTNDERSIEVIFAWCKGMN